MPYQLKKDSDENLKDYNQDSREELDLGENELGKKKHALRDERDSGFES